MVSISKLAAVGVAAALAGALPADPVVGADIVGGHASTMASFPRSIVALNLDGDQECGGVLLNANTVITAAHCIEDGPHPILWRARAGSLSWNSDGIVVNVTRFIKHPDFDYDAYVNDIALFYLATPIHQSSTVSYAVLPAKGATPPAGSNVAIAGWGLRSSSSNEGPKNLLQTVVHAVSLASCSAAFDYDLPNSEFCTTWGPAGGPSGCYGDSGGPAFDAETKSTLWGIASFKSQGNCGAPNSHDVWTKIGSYLDWINENKA